MSFAFKDVALISPKYNLAEVGYPLFEYPFPNTISYLSKLGKTKSLGMHSTFGILNDNTEGIINLYRNVIEMKKSKEYVGRRTENQTVSIEAEDEF